MIIQNQQKESSALEIAEARERNLTNVRAGADRVEMLVVEMLVEKETVKFVVRLLISTGEERILPKCLRQYPLILQISLHNGHQ